MSPAAKRKNKPVLILFLAAILLSYISIKPAFIQAASDYPGGLWPQPEEIEAKSWLVIDAADGSIIMGKNADMQVFPASTIKLLTAVLLLEADIIDQNVTVSPDAVNLPSGSSKVGFVAGETVDMQDVLAALLLASGNDAANVIAESIDGSQEEFAARMNSRASQLGMSGSNFTNPSGLHAPEQITTAADMAKLSRHAWQFPQIRDLASRRNYVMPPTDKHPYPGWAMIFNTNRLLAFGDDVLASDYIAEYNGLKTGSTYAAGYNLIAVARTHDNRELISLIFGAPLDDPVGNVFIYSRSLLEAAARSTGSPSYDEIRSEIETEASLTTTAVSARESESSAAHTPAPSATVESSRDEAQDLASPQPVLILLLLVLAILLIICAFYIVNLRMKLRIYRKMLRQCRRNKQE